MVISLILHKCQSQTKFNSRYVFIYDSSIAMIRRTTEISVLKSGIHVSYIHLSDRHTFFYFSCVLRDYSVFNLIFQDMDYTRIKYTLGIS